MKILKLFLLLSILFNLKPALSQWTAYYTSTQLFECRFINQNTGWAGGDHLNVFSTTNGGNNWTLIYSPGGNNVIYSLCFADSVHGWAGTYTGEIFRTTNGGFNWINLNPGMTGSIYSIYFSSPPLFY